MLLCGLNTSHQSMAETLQAPDLLKACDTALSSCKASNEAKDRLISTQDKQLQAQMDELSALKAKDENIIKSPFLWAPLGLVLGIVLGVVIAK